MSLTCRKIRQMNSNNHIFKNYTSRRKYENQPIHVCRGKNLPPKEIKYSKGCHNSVLLVDSIDILSPTK